MSTPPVPSVDAAVTHPLMVELVALGRRLQAWPPARAARASSSPLAVSPLRGRGMEYAESRPYLPGDDARHMDWRVTARTGIAHTKLFHPERERTTLMVCDGAPALFFGTRVRFKSVQLARAAALAAWAARRAGERVGALGAANSGQLVPFASGRSGVLSVLHALCAWYSVPPGEVRPDAMRRALERARHLVHTGSRLVLIADPTSLDSVPESLLGGLARHNDVLVVLVVDRFELSPPTRRLPLRIGEGRTSLDFGHAPVREAWISRYSEPIARLEARFRRWRIASIVMTADESEDRLIEHLVSASAGAA